MGPVVVAVTEQTLNVVQLAVVIPNVADRHLREAVKRSFHSPRSGSGLLKRLVTRAGKGGVHSLSCHIERCVGTRLGHALGGQLLNCAFRSARRSASVDRRGRPEQETDGVRRDLAAGSSAPTHRSRPLVVRNRIDIGLEHARNSVQPARQHGLSIDLLHSCAHLILTFWKVGYELRISLRRPTSPPSLFARWPNGLRANALNS